MAVFLLGSTGRSASPERQVLAGVAITSALGAFVYGVLVTSPAAFNRYRFWDVGSIADRDLDTTEKVLPFIVAGALIALALGPALNALALGEETGRALGAHVNRTRFFGMLSITLLCGAATAAAGPIGFVGLAVPYMVRVLVGPDQRRILPYSLLLAPVLLLGADITGRLVAAPGEVEAGIVTAFLGAPAFIWLVRRGRIVRL